ncbi:MAG: homocysteine S-methyltransferase family protein, partial [Candidatus Cloacimonetes bacterium]|nr:homocysteine S-methyltransferase family protein [Candidatus Cloacimonadota bacterium]
MINKPNFIQLLNEKIIVFDGAMGTSIQNCHLNSDDFQGKDGCNEWLVISKPETIRSIHESFLKAGAS